VGWTVLARNWRGGSGELDLVVERGGVVRFVEVKARSIGAVDLEGSVTAEKQKRLQSAAEAWLQVHGEPASGCAFLVALVTLEEQRWRVDWLDDAFAS
jgi:putative endonuclease